MLRAVRFPTFVVFAPYRGKKIEDSPKPPKRPREEIRELGMKKGLYRRSGSQALKTENGVATD